MTVRKRPTRRAVVTGLDWHGRVRVWALLAGCVGLAGCAIVGGPRVDPIVTNEWGAAIPTPPKGNIVLGSQPWCSRSGDPVTVEGLEWEALEGLRVVDFAVVSQDAAAERMGMLYGSLPDLVPGSYQERTVSSACSDISDDGIGATASYVVLELELTDPSSAGAAQGLSLVGGDLASGVEPLTVIVCPAEAPSCDEGDAPAGFAGS